MAKGKSFKLGTTELAVGGAIVILGYMYWKKIGPFGMMMQKPMMPWPMMPPRPGPPGMPGMPGMIGMSGAPGAPAASSPGAMVSANPITLNLGGSMTTVPGSPQYASPQTCPDGVSTPNVYGQCPPPTNPYATSTAGQYGGYPMCSDGSAINPYTGVCANGLPPLPTTPTYQTPYGTMTLPYPYSPYGTSPYSSIQSPYASPYSPYGTPSPYGTSPYGTTSPYGSYPYGTPSPYGAPTSPYASPYGASSPYTYPTGSPYGTLSPYGSSPYGTSPYGFLAESYPALTINPENALSNPEGAMSWGGSTGFVGGQAVLMTPDSHGGQFQPGFSVGGGGAPSGIGTGDWAGGGQSGFSGGIHRSSLGGLGDLDFPFNGGFDGAGGFSVPAGGPIAHGFGICPDGVTQPDPFGNCPQSIFPFASGLVSPDVDVVGGPVAIPDHDDFHRHHHDFDLFNPVVPGFAVDPFLAANPFGPAGFSPIGFEQPFNPFAENPFFQPPNPFLPPNPYTQLGYPGFSPFSNPFAPPEPFGPPDPFLEAPSPYPGGIGGIF